MNQVPDRSRRAGNRPPLPTVALGRRVVRWVSVVLIAVAPPGIARAHPVHTTLAHLSEEPNGGGLRIEVRAFADDFAAAVGRFAGVAPAADHAVPAAAIARYVAARLELIDGAGARAPLVVAGVRRSGEVVWLTVRAPTVRELAGVRFANRMLFERFADQVNIVQTSGPAGRSTLLLTGRDSAPKAVTGGR